MSPSILVLGVGNTLMGDDGVGVRLLECVRAEVADIDGIEFVDAGTLSFVLLPRIQQCGALLVLDAARLGEPAGTVRRLTGGDMDEFLRSARLSVHEVGLSDLLDLARLTGSLPARRGFIGVQPATVSWSEQLSPAVDAALPDAAAAAAALLRAWSAGPAAAAGPESPDAAP